ncbi:hypothetical protein PaG_04212 [Moesziomyces aphidis]|uniref:CDP-alcohol phosphatidyltransferase n=2 Tax=Moesziomyces TaxID=63261 RepID=M9MC17_PSEA3|nr:hypothetical protein PaG_04212 [Moesziomyces aphidis]GAC71347.1 CDP-alcohol phosphatidyltransferase [Moesziomyces antarcticus T-34]
MLGSVGLRFACTRAAPAWRPALPLARPVLCLLSTRTLSMHTSLPPRSATQRGISSSAVHLLGTSRASTLGRSVNLRGFASTSSRNDSASPPPSPPSGTNQDKAKPALSEDLLTLPNVLTMLRLALTPYIGYLVATHQFAPACVLLFVASITDVLDGWLARRTGKYTVFGSIADPAADKALVTTMVVSLALSGMLPWPIATVILGRDVALVASAFVIRYRTLQPPKTLQRYFNPRLPSASVTPTQISKYNTFLQLLLLGILTMYPLLYPNSPPPPLVPTKQEDDSTKRLVDRAVAALMWITAATTVWSGLGYIGGAGARKVLAQRAPSLLARNKPPPKP